MTQPQPADKSPPEPWWRVGVMWLVVGGPAVVVVAGLSMVVLAAMHRDPALSPQERARMAQAVMNPEHLVPAREARQYHLEQLVAKPPKPPRY
jgi:hypothetical protein